MRRHSIVSEVLESANYYRCCILNPRLLHKFLQEEFLSYFVVAVLVDVFAAAAALAFARLRFVLIYP